MKKVIVLAVVAIMGTTVAVNAQKIGHINTNDLLMAMPETKKAQDKLKGVLDSLNVVYGELIKEYQEKDSIIRADSGRWTPAIKQIRFKEFQDLLFVCILSVLFNRILDSFSSSQITIF